MAKTITSGRALIFAVEVAAEAAATLNHAWLIIVFGPRSSRVPIQWSPYGPRGGDGALTSIIAMELGH
ncbi:hypothetical protein ACJZ2D_008732 [Fusarium nematophilum]